MGARSSLLYRYQEEFGLSTLMSLRYWHLGVCFMDTRKSFIL